MVSFESDYNNGVAPEILRAFEASNDDTTSGYGHDKYTESAKAKIRRAIGMPEADICFLVGGTQTNATVIDSLLRGGEGNDTLRAAPRSASSPSGGDTLFGDYGDDLLYGNGVVGKEAFPELLFNTHLYLPPLNPMSLQR